jgi:hypothetical protein
MNDATLLLPGWAIALGIYLFGLALGFYWGRCWPKGDDNHE